MEQFQVKGRTLVIRMPKELDHHTTGQIPGNSRSHDRREEYSAD